MSSEESNPSVADEYNYKQLMRNQKYFGHKCQKEAMKEPSKRAKKPGSLNSNSSQPKKFL